MEPVSKARRLIYCEHCSKEVPKSTYYRHRSEFYDEATQKWRTCASKRPKDTLFIVSCTRLYLSLVRPMMEYASCVWDPHEIVNIQALEKVQRRAARWVPS